jgi:hypothetical protein
VRSILTSFQVLFDRKDVRPGCVFALQTFGADAGNRIPGALARTSIEYAARPTYLLLTLADRRRYLETRGRGE